MLETPDPHHPPVIVVGAGRSGTNILRDVLTQLPGFGTWPCDEINYIWRHGNRDREDDEFSADLATPSVIRFLRGRFDALARRQRLEVVVEKTCANSLRVPFVHRVFPRARFVFLVRDGIDVTASAMQRWTAPLDLPYLLRKARFVPPSDLAHYGARYLAERLQRRSSPDRRLPSWGPRFAGMREAVRDRPLAEVCALQWARCVDKAERDLAQLPPEQVLTLRYEDFVGRPVDELGRIVRFLGADVPTPLLAGAARGVRASSVGRGHDALEAATLASLEPLVAPILERHGYRDPVPTSA